MTHARPTMWAALERRKNIPIGTIINVGASDGRWTRMAMGVWPTAANLLIEANPIHEPALQEFWRRHSPNRPAMHIAMAVASDGAGGQIHFDGRDPWGGAASKSPAEGSKSVLSTTVDLEVQRAHLPGPYLLKLDTHGHERFILDGARETLQQTDLLVLEVYNFRLSPGCLRFWEMCDCLAPLGFRPIDLVDPMWRPCDGVLWQCDMFFARETRPEFRSRKYDGT